MRAIPSRRQFVASLAAAASSTLALPAFAQTTTDVVVGTIPAPDMGALLYSRAQGLFTKAGINVDIQQMQNGAAILAGMVGGSVQIGYGNVYTWIQAYQRGIPIRLIAPGSLYQSTVPTIKLLAAADSTITSAKDLAGKTIGTTLVNDITGLSLVAWLTREGVDPRSVKFFEMPPNLMVAALQQKRVDAILIFEPFLTAALASGAKTIGTPFDAIGSNFLASAWIAVNPWLNEHRQAAKEFNAVMARSGAYANTHYSEMVPLLAEFSKIPVAVLNNMKPSLTPPNLTPAMLQPVIDAALKFQRIPAAVKAQDMILPGV